MDAKWSQRHPRLAGLRLVGLKLAGLKLAGLALVGLKLAGLELAGLALVGLKLAGPMTASGSFPSSQLLGPLQPLPIEPRERGGAMNGPIKLAGLASQLAGLLLSLVFPSAALPRRPSPSLDGSPSAAVSKPRRPASSSIPELPRPSQVPTAARPQVATNVSSSATFPLSCPFTHLLVKNPKWFRPIVWSCRHFPSQAGRGSGRLPLQLWTPHHQARSWGHLRSVSRV